MKTRILGTVKDLQANSNTCVVVCRNANGDEVPVFLHGVLAKNAEMFLVAGQLIWVEGYPDFTGGRKAIAGTTIQFCGKPKKEVAPIGFEVTDF